ncbi:chaperonin GroES [Limimonas halophila]|uniref:Co-chaperonin GroES n=1 Tax=Limimonas halophila TaxID=1082479 RepID=A0A1G7RAC9_9PROT|nr:co-chaperone GroES [Limimonas halophila]SDG07722.1 chaperonin GroES [Limimonas halophila]
MTFRPLHDRILVERVEQEEQTSGGIIIPDTAKEKPMEAEVVAVGAGAKDENGNRLSVDVEVGQRVLIGKYAGTDVKLDGKDYTILRENDVLGILTKGEGAQKAA